MGIERERCRNNRREREMEVERERCRHSKPERKGANKPSSAP